ncbi:UNVERIFIED_ORG: hypothetical protein GGE64_005546 [Rhizobium etli]|jgi:hypothetical protein|nr:MULTISPECIES: hypothetical protein [Rhizobium]MBB4300773.1 hypothetical protein [Rhizobium leguminosarum]MBB4421106.1 hypothetical protein [Rhizobium leguminosarum]MBB4436304.1 hypothetical protein [Rhizobium esperanzae]MBB4546019.1 hypothetical protein [Rhizobium leguminosarum]MBB5655634.1 hypothetical protein [Rhizobium leguminosarum]
MRRLTALKFYGLAYAARSVVTTGLEAVDDFLVIMAQPGGARKTMEQHVLPVVAESQLTDMILPTRSMYAIVLAWCGEFGMARRELAALREYAMDGPQSEMLKTRAKHVEAVIAGTVRLERQVPPPGSLAKILGRGPAGQRKLGRNEKCECGSGLKYKNAAGM